MLSIVQGKGKREGVSGKANERYDGAVELGRGVCLHHFSRTLGSAMAFSPTTRFTSCERKIRKAGW